MTNLKTKLAIVALEVSAVARCLEKANDRVS